MSQRFDGKVAIVTGVSDRGIGGAIIDRLAEEGAAVACLWHQPPRRVLNRLKRMNVPRLDGFCDVCDHDSVTAAVNACLAEFGRIDVLVNNAGVEIAQSFEDLTDEDWFRMVNVNLTGAMRMTRAVLPHLTSPEGVIVNIASVLGMAACAGFPAYSATKAGLIGMTQSLAVELAPRGIRAVCVSPALVHTPMLHRHTKGDPDVERRILDCHPLGVGMTHDVAAAVAFLASSEARWITGVALPLGWLPAFPMPVEHLMHPASQRLPAAGRSSEAASAVPARSADYSVNGGSPVGDGSARRR